MEVVEVPGYSGKYEVLFNGRPEPCFDDTDCSGAGICAVNQTWSMIPGGYCICNTKYGFEGLNCDQWCAQAVQTLVMNLLATIVSLALALTATWLLVRILCCRGNNRDPTTAVPTAIGTGPSRANTERTVRGRMKNTLRGMCKPIVIRPATINGTTSLSTQNRPRRKCGNVWNPVTLALVVAAVGQWWFFAATIMDNVVTLTFPYVHDHFINSREKRVTRTPQSLLYMSNAFWAFAFCFTLCSVVVLPLAWIDIATRYKLMKKNQSEAVMIGSVVCLIIILSIELPFYILAAQQYRARSLRWSLAALIAWAVVFGFIIILNAVVVFRVRGIRQDLENAGNVNDGLPSASSSASLPVRRMMERIEMASVQITVVSIATLVLISFGHIRDQRSLYSDPRCYLDPADFAYNFCMFLVLYLCGITLWFVYPSAMVMAGVTFANRSTTRRASRGDSHEAAEGPRSSMKEIPGGVGDKVMENEAIEERSLNGYAATSSKKSDGGTVHAQVSSPDHQQESANEQVAAV